MGGLSKESCMGRCCSVELGSSEKSDVKAPWQYDVAAVNTRAPYVQQYWVTLAQMLQEEADKQLESRNAQSLASQQKFYNAVNREDRGLLDKTQELYDRINKELVPII